MSYFKAKMHKIRFWLRRHWISRVLLLRKGRGKGREGEKEGNGKRRTGRRGRQKREGLKGKLPYQHLFFQL